MLDNYHNIEKYEIRLEVEGLCGQLIAPLLYISCQSPQDYTLIILKQLTAASGIFVDISYNDQ